MKIKKKLEEWENVLNRRKYENGNYEYHSKIYRKQFPNF